MAQLRSPGYNPSSKKLFYAYTRCKLNVMNSEELFAAHCIRVFSGYPFTLGDTRAQYSTKFIKYKQTN